MPSLEVKRKFRKRGRRTQFAALAGVRLSAVSMWLSGKSPSARLDRLAREWRPTRPAPVPPNAAAGIEEPAIA